MALYAGLFLVAISIGYLVVSYFQSRTSGASEKVEKTVSSGSRGKPVGRTLGRSALVSGTVQKPWGW